MNNQILMEQDKKNREIALNPHQSFIVQAPAGSGKTELLIQRLLVLLHQVNKPEEILAITFTKKAANEMRARVLKALKTALYEKEPTSAHAKKTWDLAQAVLKKDEQLAWNLINNPNQLRIQTIDSLCAHLTKQLPLLSHFGSQPDITDQPQLIYSQAVQEVLGHLEQDADWSPAISQLLLHLDNDYEKLHKLLVSLLSKRDQWLPYIQLHEQDIRQELESYLKIINQTHISKVINLFPKQYINELLHSLRYAANTFATRQKDSGILACLDIHALPNQDEKNAWLGIVEFFLTKDGEWRKTLNIKNGFPAANDFKNKEEKQLATDNKEKAQALINKLNDYEALRLTLDEIRTLPQTKYKNNQWQTLQHLLYVLKILAAQLRLSFQEYGCIDYIENSQAALLALGQENNPTDLALALDYQIKHLLIDEFQDTAITQFQLLEKLILGWENNDGRTLFVVGDPMQSIYRFREAEVGLFIRMQEHGIGHIKLTPLTLSVNFRSSPQIVEWNNQQFQQIFPSVNDIASGAITYSPSTPFNQAQTGDEIQIQGFMNDNISEANHIIKTIQTTLEKYPNQSIAILVRARNHLADIIPQLKKANLPFKAIDIDALASKQAIQDVFALTTAMLCPSNKVAWFSILRAPWCGLKLEDLFLLSKHARPNTLILEQLQQTEIIDSLSIEAKSRLQKIIPLLVSKINERERYDLRTWIESTWLLLGGPACIEENEINDMNAFFELLQKFGTQNSSINLNELEQSMKSLFANGGNNEAQIHIMTIHSSKGLEFDTVFLPHLEKRIPNDDKTLLAWTEQPLTQDKNALLISPMYGIGHEKDSIYEYIRRQQKNKLSYESDRLFYVATTRAKRRLFLSFSTADQEKISGDSSFIQKIEKTIPIMSKPGSEISREETILPKKYFKKLSVNWQNPIIEKYHTTVATHLDDSSFSLKDNTKKQIGIVVHYLLDQISKQSFSWWQNMVNQRDYIKYKLSQFGLANERLFNAILAIEKIMQNISQSKKALWLLSSHPDAHSEWAVTAVIDNKLENLVIDRSFIDEQGTRWIVDYKTTAFSTQDMQEFLLKEQEKYKKKMQQYAEALKIMEDRPIKLALYFPALDTWHEWENKGR